MSKEVAKAQRTGFTAGVENPGAIAYTGFALVYLLMPPVIFLMTKPGSAVETAVDLTWRTLLPYASSVPKDRVIPALATIYATFAYGCTGGISVAGAAMGNKRGLDNNHPRAHVSTLRGLPLRLKSAHDHLMETFPMWAVAAGLAQLLAPRNQQMINILGLAMLSKIAVHYPAYIANISPVRSIAHLIATASSTAALYALATGAK